MTANEIANSIKNTHINAITTRGRIVRLIDAYGFKGKGDHNKNREKNGLTLFKAVVRRLKKYGIKI